MIATEREKEIIDLVVKGFKSKDIADVLSITDKTVKWHLTKIYSNNGCVNRVDLVNKYHEEKNK